MKILEICPFTSGICGVWSRVSQESSEFSKLGHTVKIFSTNIEKGTNNISSDCEVTNDKIIIKRFKAKSSLASKNVYDFNFDDAFLEYSPDVVITHLLHPHSFKALKLCQKNNIPCYLVTHAPFNVKRKFPLNLATTIYNKFKVKPLLNKFTKIVAITKWEYPYLKKLGVDTLKITYIPNGLPEEFFVEPSELYATTYTRDVLFLGRIAPIKDLETLLYAARILPNIKFTIVGSPEKEYLETLEQIIKGNDMKNVKILPPIYDLKEKINLIDSHDIFVLPSVREAMPQVLLEAMAREKIVITSNTDGGKEIIQDNENGFIFNIGDFASLAKIIQDNIGGVSVQLKAGIDARNYSWKKLIKLYKID